MSLTNTTYSCLRAISRSYTLSKAPSFRSKFFNFSSMATQHSLPPTHRALTQRNYGDPLTVANIPTPQPVPGSAILRVNCAAVVSYQKLAYNNTWPNRYEAPMVPGSWAIGRVAAVGPDAVSLKEGALVLFSNFIRARDDPSTAFLSGFADFAQPGSRKLMSGEWRESTYAQFVKAPLENCFPVDEGKMEKLGYKAEEMLWAGLALVGYGGLRSIDVKAGETVIVAPATGGFSGAAAVVAAAMGARVIAMGRNKETLQHLKKFSTRIHTVAMTGDEETEMKELASFGCIDAFLDLSPIPAVDSTHLKSAIKSLRSGGRVSLMGGLLGDSVFPYRAIVHQGLTVKGQWMYSPDDARDMIKMIENDVLSLKHVKVAGKFDLEDWEKAFETAAAMKFNEVTALSS